MVGLGWAEGAGRKACGDARVEDGSGDRGCTRDLIFRILLWRVSYAASRSHSPSRGCVTSGKDDELDRACDAN